MRPLDLREDFLLHPELTYLNHGSFGACARPAFEAYQRFQRELEENPMGFLARESGARLAVARAALAEALVGRESELAFVTNATHAVNAIARSIDLRAGDEVLATDLEYGACDVTWERACTDRGAHYRRVPIALPFQPQRFASEVLAHVTPRTRVVFASHITSSTALVLPVAELCVAARRRSILTVIDGAHAAGQIALDLGGIDADVYFGVAHKWMCAPKGVGFVSVRTSLHDMVRGVVTSWGEHAAADDSAELQALTGTSNLERRFQWQGTRDIAAFLAVPAAIDFQRVHHWADWQRSCHDLAVDAAKRILGRNGLTALAPEHCVAQMVSVPVATRDSPALAKWLREESGIETLATEHRGQALLRISVQAYNGERDLQRLDRAMALAGV